MHAVPAPFGEKIVQSQMNCLGPFVKNQLNIKFTFATFCTWILHMDREWAKMTQLVTDKMNKEEVFSGYWLKE